MTVDREALAWAAGFGYYAGGFEKTQAILAMLWPFLSLVKRGQGQRSLAKFHAARGTKGMVRR